MVKPTANLSTTQKTKMVSFRCPIQLFEKLPTTGRTEWILEAIQDKLAKEIQTPNRGDDSDDVLERFDEIEAALRNRFGEQCADQLIDRYGHDIHKLQALIKQD